MKNYLVIGASSGIGKQLAHDLASKGHQVYATYFKNRPDEQIHGIQYHYHDVTGDVVKLDFLPLELDGLVYCPGSITLKPFHRLTAENFLDDYKLQVIGAVRSIQSVLPRLKTSTSASIVLFSTIAVRSGFNFHSLVSASKGAIEGLTLALAAELAPGIRVNCIAPSLTDTPLSSGLLNTEIKREANAQRHPLKRVGTPADIAAMAAFLLSDDASWITGQVMHLDGGLSVIKG